MLSEDEARKRREQLERRPSYRMILKDIAMAGDIKKEIEESSSDRTNNGNLLGNFPFFFYPFYFGSTTVL